MKSKEELLKAYLATFDEKEKQGYEIAKSHLGSSFDLSKSLGYLQWLKVHTGNL
jgi:hypothetical protein